MKNKFIMKKKNERFMDELMIYLLTLTCTRIIEISLSFIQWTNLKPDNTRQSSELFEIFPSLDSRICKSIDRIYT